MHNKIVIVVLIIFACAILYDLRRTIRELTEKEKKKPLCVDIKNCTESKCPFFNECYFTEEEL